MGMLDGLFSNDPQSQGILALASGLLSNRGNFGQNLGQSLNQSQNAYGGAQEQNAKIGFQQAQTEMSRASAAKMMQELAMQKAFQDYLSQSPQPAAQSSLPSDFNFRQGSAAANAGGNSGVAPTPQAPDNTQGPIARMTPEMMAMASLSGVPGAAGLPGLAKTANEGYTLPAGWYRDSNGNVGYRPTVSTSQNGQASVTSLNPQTGQLEVAAPKGALESYAGYKGVDALIGALTNPQRIKDANGTEYMSSVADLLGIKPQLNAFIKGAPVATVGAPPGRGNQPGMVAPPPTNTGVNTGIVPANTGVARGGMGTQIGPTVATQRAQEATTDLNKDWIKTSYNPVLDEGKAAQDAMAGNAVARKGLSMVGGGSWGTAAQAAAANVLSGLGIASEDAKKLATGSQVFQQAAMTKLWQVLNLAKGPQTEGDAARASKTAAQLENTPAANQFILDLSDALNQRKVLQRDFYSRAMPVARDSGDLTEVDRAWLEKQPSVFSMPSMKKYNVQQ